MRHTFKALVAVVTGVALMTLTTVPSAAQTGTVTGGTFGLTLTTTLVVPVDLAATTDPNCASTVDVVMNDHNSSSASTGHVAITVRAPFTIGAGNNYYLTLSYSSSTATFTHTTTSDQTVTTSTFTITNANFWSATGTDSCTPSSTSPKCSNLDVLFASGLSGTFTGTIASTPPHTLSGSLHLGGAGQMAAAGCTPPFSGFNGKAGTFSSVTASL